MVSMPEEEWTLELPGGQTSTSAGFPKSIREVVLVGALHCEQVREAMKAGAVSLAEVASLMSKFHLLGCDGPSNHQVQLLSDEDLRRFCTACGAPVRLHLGLGQAEGLGLGSVADFVVARERQKAEETVKLNVSGQHYEVHRMTAERIPLVAAMLRFPRDADAKAIFVDASPKAFDVLLEMARGRKRTYIDTLEPSLKVLVEAYAEYVGMPVASMTGFDFKLTATHPNNQAVKNAFAYLSENETKYTTGVRQQWNTVFGSSPCPSSGQSYWEVEVVKLGSISADFAVGVVTSSFGHQHGILDSNSQGAGLALISQTVCMRYGGQNGPALTESFPIFQGIRVGVLFDADRGSLMFFHNGSFKCSNSANFKGQALVPAFSVLADSELSIKTGLTAPS